MIALLLLALPGLALAAPLTVTLSGDDCVKWSVELATPPVITCVARATATPPPAPTPTPTPPSGPVAITSCPGYTAAQTKVMDVVIPATGMNRYYVTSTGAFRDNKRPGFGANDVMVVVFKAPATPNPAFQVTFVQTGAGANGPVSARTIVLSKKPCDFAYPTRSSDAIWANEGATLSLTLASGTTPSPSTRYLLTPGREYYLNIRNKTSSGGGCATERCDIIVSTNN